MYFFENSSFKRASFCITCCYIKRCKNKPRPPYMGHDDILIFLQIPKKSNTFSTFTFKLITYKE